MSATTYTLTGNIRDALRTDASELQDLRGYLEPSQVAIADPSDNTVSLGNVALSIDPATGGFSALILGTGGLVAGWRLVLLWRDSSLADSGRQVQRFTSGYFTMTANKTLAAAFAEAGSGVAVPIGPTLDSAMAANAQFSSSAFRQALSTALGIVAGPADSTNRKFDTMNGTAGTRLNAHTGGVPWTEVTGTWTVQSNNASSTSSTALATFDAGQAAWTYSADVKTTGDNAGAFSQIGLVWNYIDPNNFLFAQIMYPYISGTTTPSVQVYRNTANTLTLLVDLDLAVPSGISTYTINSLSNMRLDKFNSDVTISLGGIELVTICDTQGQSSNIVGARIGTLGSPTTYAALANVRVQDYQVSTRINWPHTEQNKFSGNPLVQRSTTNNPSNTTLATALSLGTSYTSISVAPLSMAVSIGDSIKLTNGSNTQVSLATAAAPVNATTVQVRSFAANFAYPSGSTVGNFGADSSDVLAPSISWDPQNNRWVLQYSMIPADGTQQINMGLAYANDLYGPWVKEPTNPVMLGTGQGSIDGCMVYLPVPNKWLEIWNDYSPGNGPGVSISTAPAAIGPWTKQPGGVVTTGGIASWAAREIGDPYVRLKQDGRTLEAWFGASPNAAPYKRQIGRMTSTDDGATWTFDAKPFLPDNGISTEVSFSAVSVYVPPGKEGQQYLVTFDIAPRQSPAVRSMGQAVTLDNGATWHYRVVSGPNPANAYEAGAACDSFFIYAGGTAYLFYSGCLYPGLIVGIGGTLALQSTPWDGRNLKF